MARAFRILAATDGSSSARAALATAIAFPWPQPSSARAVVALGPTSSRMRGALRAAATRALYAQTDPARRTLARRWSHADAVALHEAPADAIFSEARRFRADVIVLGWRGHGTLRRLLAGSVSREVVARARSPVLVVRTAARAVRRVIVGFDGSAGAFRAVRFVGKLAPPRGGRVTVVSVLEPLPLPPSARRMPAAMRATLRREAVKLNRSRARSAQRKADAAAARLKRSGWRAVSELRFGTPLDDLLQAAASHKADVLVVGARAAVGLRRALLGSVASGALNHSRVPVLVVP
jgi:nucleotide-binding universal stress UspA family protein